MKKSYSGINAWLIALRRYRLRYYIYIGTRQSIELDKYRYFSGIGDGNKTGVQK